MSGDTYANKRRRSSLFTIQPEEARNFVRGHLAGDSERAAGQKVILERE